MAESTTIRADQIEGLPDLIREQVRAALRQETQPFLQDMEEIRRSPAGILIRLEEQLRALEEKMDQRFAGLKAEMDQRFAGLKAEMDQRFIAVDQRFTSIDQRFQEVDKRLTLLQWTMGLVLILQVLILGKLFFPP